MHVAALRAEIDFILLCRSFYKEFVKNVKKASSLKSEPLRKTRYRDDKINKKSITKKKPHAVYTQRSILAISFLISLILLSSGRLREVCSLLFCGTEMICGGFQTQRRHKSLHRLTFLLKRGEKKSKTSLLNYHGDSAVKQ